MHSIYIDESGDLGISSLSSQHFVLVAIKVNDDKTNILCSRIPKFVRKKLLKKRFKKTSELKFSNSSEHIRNIFLQKAAKLDIEIYSLIINKQFIKEKLKKNLPILYNYLIKILLEKVLVNLNKNKQLVICLDKSMSASQRVNFENYIKTEFLYLFKDIPCIKFIHENSHHNPNLQVTDFICGAFGYKYNTANCKSNCDCYTSIVKSKIKIERNDLFK